MSIGTGVGGVGGVSGVERQTGYDADPASQLRDVSSRHTLGPQWRLDQQKEYRL